MFNLVIDPLETYNLLNGGLTSEEQNLKIEFENEANQRRSAWSCKDDIQNGDEHGIDCGGTYCSPCSASLLNPHREYDIVSVYPNPADNSIWISSSDESIQNLKIYNVI